MTIHSEHPFATPSEDRQPVRRFRGRMPSPVSVWTTGEGAARTGWTLSSFLVADGEPAEVVGVLDPDSDLAAALQPGEADGVPLVVNLLGWADRQVADVFAQVAPAPGGPFRVGRWSTSDWGPVLTQAPGWLGARVVQPPTRAGWGLLVRAVVEHAHVSAELAEPVLSVFRGRYRPIA